MVYTLETYFMAEQLSSSDKKLLLILAREALEIGVQGGHLQPLLLDELPEKLREEGVTFVTLTIEGYLRGCIGALEPIQPLAEDVRQHAIGAALNDYRFLPVRSGELKDLTIEISYLTPLEPLEYKNPDDLVKHIRPSVDGVVIRDGINRATFLPQVWEKIPEPESFLGMLCQKMGASPDLWQRKKLEVLTYQVEKFSE